MSRAFPLCVRIHLRIVSSLDTECRDSIVFWQVFSRGRHFGRPIATHQNVWITLRGELRWIGLNDSDVESALHDGARRTRDHACVRSLWRRPTVQGCTRATSQRRSATALNFSTRDLFSCRFIQVDPPGEWACAGAAQGPACRTPTAPNHRPEAALAECL